MAGLIEFVPNFSEGRRGETIEALARAARGAEGARLLDYSADRDHNRSVFTLAGSPEGVAGAAIALCRVAAERIDLREHRGEHPRIGASDVFPFVPLRGTGMAECAALARRVGERVWRELGIPVYLYGEAAGRPERRSLPAIRRGGFEGLGAKMLLPEWAPDYGGRAPHPSAGAVAVGARGPLIAFNINLDTPDGGAARAIARKIRASSGGLPACRAIGVVLRERGLSQVSINLTDYRKTSLPVVYEAVKAEAGRLGVSVAGSEIIGLAPARALTDCAAAYLHLEGFDTSRVLEGLE